MLGFLRRNRVLVMSALCLVLGAGLAVGTSRDRNRRDWLGRLFLEVLAPLQRLTSGVRTAVGGSVQSVRDLYQARDENVRLREALRRATDDLGRLTELEMENTRLRGLLAFKETLHGDLLTARVIGRDATGLSRTIVIGRGEADGIVKGAAVLAPAGIVGQVFRASRHAARVLLITDHNSGVDGLVQRTRARGIVQGTVDAGCGLKYVKRTEDVQVGDVVITSGLDGIFPKGLPIGQVSSVDKRGQGLFQSADITPQVDVDQLEEVLVTRGAVLDDDGEKAP